LSRGQAVEIGGGFPYSEVNAPRRPRKLIECRDNKVPLYIGDYEHGHHPANSGFIHASIPTILQVSDLRNDGHRFQEMAALGQTA